MTDKQVNSIELSIFMVGLLLSSITTLEWWLFIFLIIMTVINDYFTTKRDSLLEKKRQLVIKLKTELLERKEMVNSEFTSTEFREWELHRWLDLQDVEREDSETGEVLNVLDRVKLLIMKKEGTRN